MVTKPVNVRRMRRVAKAKGVGLAIFLLTGLAVARAEQKPGTVAAPPLVATKNTGTSVSPATIAKPIITDYTVSPEDLLDVNVLDVPEVTREYRVSSNGFLTLPLLQEPIPVAGETLDELQHLIAAKFREAGMLNNAVVTVSLRETRHHAVLVSGEVAKPQSLPLYGATRLLDVLVQAGGLTADAGNAAIIVRGEMGARADLAEAAESSAPNQPLRGQTFTLDIRKLVTTGDDTTNILLYPGDRVTVQRAELVYILGAVNRPGGYVLSEARQQVTVLKALAMAGDVTGTAKKQHITILRRDPAGPGEKRDEIPVNYKAMVNGKIADTRMQADDILYVPESRSLKAWHTSISTASAVATQGGAALLIYR